jgi:hypothetical protein
VPPRKRKVTYPVAKTATKSANATGGAEPPKARQTVVNIDVSAGSGRTDLAIGDRVRITGTGLYSGEAATIEKFAFGAIPAALVRTDAGRTRQVRTIDLEPIVDAPRSAATDQGEGASA